MKWIKASEMLSPDLRAIHIKRPPNGFPVIGHYVPSKNQYWIPIYGEYWDIEKVEWLDESAESDSGEQVRKLREGLGEVLKEYEYSCKLMAEANGMFWSENNVSISAKQLLTETDG